jgi:hypothetical protein
MQDGGKSEARGAFAALRLARAGGADPQRLFAAKVHISILTEFFSHGLSGAWIFLAIPRSLFAFSES